MKTYGDSKCIAPLIRNHIPTTLSTYLPAYLSLLIYSHEEEYKSSMSKLQLSNLKKCTTNTNIFLFSLSHFSCSCHEGIWGHRCITPLILNHISSKLPIHPSIYLSIASDIFVWRIYKLVRKNPYSVIRKRIYY
jgi:hypothetical protein